MQQKFTLMILFSLMMTAVVAQQQTRTLTGLVTSADGFPLEGVSIQVKGKKYFSGSQADGIYYIPVQPQDSVLIFWHTDYVAEEIKITTDREYNIKLKNRNRKRTGKQ